MRLSKAPVQKGTWLNGKLIPGNQLQKSKKINDRMGAYAQYNTKQGEEIYAKVAVSFISIEQATAWLEAEIPARDYDKVKATAIKKWNSELGKIKVEGGSERDRRIFYTASYHASIMPRNKMNDAVGYKRESLSGTIMLRCGTPGEHFIH